MNELLKKMQAAQNGLKNILAAATSEERGLTDEEKTKVSNYKESIENYKNLVALEKEQLENEKFLNENSNVPQASVPSKPDVRVKPGQNETIHSNMGEMLMDIKNYRLTGEMSEKLVKNAALGGNTQVPEDGGFLVEKTHANEILKVAYEKSALAGKCRRQIVTKGDRFTQNYIKETSRQTGSRMGGIQAYWINEADSLTPSKPKMGQIDLKLGKLTGLYYATDEALQDAAALAFNSKSWFADEFAWMLDDAIINGNGVGKPLGLLNSNSIIEIAKESGQTKETVVFENIKKMYYRLLANSRGNSEFLMSQDTEEELSDMALTVGTGGVPVFMPANGISGKPYSTLYGRPITTIEQCSKLGTRGDIILTDLSQYLLIDKAQGIKADVSIHVQFLTDQKAFRYIYRVNGIPILQSSITPANGSTKKLSTSITLAARA